MISENHYKWIIADIGFMMLGAINVPRGSNSTALELEYILKHSDVKYCFVENDEQKEKILSIKKKLPKLKYLIVFNKSKNKLKKTQNKNVKIVYFDNILEQGMALIKKYEIRIKSISRKIKANDIVTIIYTSGTTGIPKGVMLSHKNILHNIKTLPVVIQIEKNERWLSVLPIWHVFERTIEYIILATGGLIGYSKPMAKFLLPDFQEIKPTFMVAVPRIWEALYIGVISRVKKESKIKYLMIIFFIKTGTYYSKALKEFKGLMPLFKKPFFFIKYMKKVAALIIIILLYPLDLLAELLVFKKIRSLTGGHLRGPISGGGALPEYVDNFYMAIKMEILEGWGLTETAPVNGVRTFKTKVPRTVGPLAPGVKIMIGDEKGRKLANQSEKGIVYLKGDNIMAGYYKEPEMTKKAFTKDGWFNTGDLGRLTLTGELQLCGRYKDTIVLLGGENVEPEPIENKILECPIISQVMIVGQDKKVLGALIVPSFDNLESFVKKNKINFKSNEELYKNRLVIEEIKKEIKNKINERNGFKDYERIIFFTLISKPFEPGNELTHSLKMKRNVIADNYKNLIEKMFL